MNADEIRLMSPLDLRPTEQIIPGRVRDVIAMIVTRQAWTQPICLERTTFAILDGHHRHAAAIQLGLGRVPVRILAYDDVALTSWRAEIRPTREDVLRRARAGELYPPKTTRHFFEAKASETFCLQALLW
ncbi:ParB N-terminal domain-containing protein [Methylobacterium haplocladii]|uniref:ParB-like N-terminal domain-containing protein n=1 Tax=Methylobacterium haplocladii TaxID=1176176 RepID=A0A512INT2_9HYPH|nr:ParB N-terminal domain-containing protein [Methylobacterium haplocladii]GEO99312.1 hypothetical protein MHA02_17000 [Methylobacterium haplocladii]GJD83487.1 hypothetical protein HPGCJGGD_1354 [Methylobacterium haplocladii]GLS61088.1 hypothetical protein GCM10007887_37820 [Methylobacterium haplocladii]